MTSPQKSKGNSHERDTAKFLSDTYSLPFVRIPNSGAYVGGRNSHRIERLDNGQTRSFKGDLMPPETWINFNSECKFYKDFSWHLLFNGECKQLDTWIEQLLEVEDENDVSIIFMKFNRIGKYVVVSGKFPWSKDCYFQYNSVKYKQWCIFSQEEFFRLNKDLLETLCTVKDSSSNILKTNN